MILRYKSKYNEIVFIADERVGSLLVVNYTYIDVYNTPPPTTTTTTNYWYASAAISGHFRLSKE